MIDGRYIFTSTDDTGLEKVRITESTSINIYQLLEMFKKFALVSGFQQATINDGFLNEVEQIQKLKE